MNYQWLFEKPIAHRGTHDIYPENSLPAFAEAINNDLHIEIDVHLTKDGHLVVFHDHTLKRVCGVDLTIKNATLEEIKKYGICGTDYKIPTLEEFLDFINGKTGILLEIKGTNPFDLSIVKAVIEKVKGYNGPIALQSFNFGAVIYAKKHCKVPVGELCTWAAPDHHNLRWFPYNFMGHLWICYFTRPNFISYDIEACDPSLSENKWINKWGQKLPIISWTITTKEKMETAKEFANNVIFEYLDSSYVKDEHLNFNKFKHYK